MRGTLAVLALGMLGCQGAAELETRSMAVVGGSASPEELGFSLNRLERHAALGARVGGRGGCSGTLVGDRIVVSAAHCAITNQAAWTMGAAAVPLAAERLSFVAGDDLDAAICTLPVATIALDPDVHPETTGSEHDLAIAILAESAMAKCPGLVPIQPNLEPLEQTLLDEMVLQGGYGSLDYDYEFSTLRYWSLLQVSEVADNTIQVTDQGKGGPSYGDSGSGLLRRFPDGTLRTLGADSTMASDRQSHTFARLDSAATFFRATVGAATGPDPMCGSVTAKGSCVDGAVVRCTPEGFRSLDCRAEQKECAVDETGTAACVCLDCEPPPSSGCALVAGRAGPSGWGFLLGLAALALGRARRGQRHGTVEPARASARLGGGPRCEPAAIRARRRRPRR